MTARPDPMRAEVWHPGVFLAEEMQARGWTPRDVAERMGDLTHKGLIINEMVVLCLYGEFLLPTDGTDEIGDELARRLGAAFDVSPEFWLNLEAAWRAPAHKKHRFPEPWPYWGPDYEWLSELREKHARRALAERRP